MSSMHKDAYSWVRYDGLFSCIVLFLFPVIIARYGISKVTCIQKLTYIYMAEESSFYSSVCTDDRGRYNIN